MCPRLQVENVDVLMSCVEPHATCRDDAGGRNREYGIGLQALLDLANAGMASAGELMSIVALLRPYSGKNGRCGRTLSMWRILYGKRHEVAALTREAPRQPVLHVSGKQLGEFH